jgi:hypothetical protein
MIEATRYCLYDRKHKEFFNAYQQEWRSHFDLSSLFYDINDVDDFLYYFSQDKASKKRDVFVVPVNLSYVLPT